ncbi:MAG: 30S ribosomal protein S6 [Deltaproteobacteria bacterium]|nr:30S ribosomal protein S6 [Deltaproteobacteria bacterium]MBW1923327.1 30S ribosomal protein S6 [Deltaproteobacteria bacterium]MBW1949964.1 30S ribosomal protein S6 [Deltaproteobacteria bacterium]MBW2007909.1 30S ribosomal protein S6 [Deltaproteobacteria bacterium]MBW2101900.1 30S ribosomal protein S6 [Deltaproteobacteria bacterium]
MRHYEIIYILKGDLAEEDYRALLEKVGSTVEKAKGQTIKVDEWGLKTLAYPIKKYHKGHYVLMEFCGGPETTRELERQLKLDDRVLKYQTVKISDQADVEALKAAQQETTKKEEEPAAEVEKASDKSGDSKGEEDGDKE